jgi:hypothetical protein
VIHSPPTNRRNSVLRNSTIAVTPTITPPSIKKIEKDILKHASRIRTNSIRDSFRHHQNFIRSQSQSQSNVNFTSVSNTPTRINPPTNLKRNTVLQPSRTINLVSFDSSEKN